MKLTYRLFRKQSGIYFCEDRVTRRQESLRTRDKQTAVQLLNAKNEARRQPMLNQQIARAYLAGSDSGVATRTWQDAMSEVVSSVLFFLPFIVWFLSSEAD